MQSAQRNVTKRVRKRGGETKRAPRERDSKTDGLALLSPLWIWVKCVHSTFNTISKWRTLLADSLLSIYHAGVRCSGNLFKQNRQLLLCREIAPSEMLQYRRTHTHTLAELKFRSRLVNELRKAERTSCGTRV